MNLGLFYMLMGVASAVIFSGIGSSLGLGLAGEAAAGVMAEDPEKFGKVIVLQALPMTQSIYGLVIGIIMIINYGQAELTTASGLALLAVGLSVGIVGLVSGFWQGRVATAGIHMTAKQPEQSGKAIILAVMVETCALFAFLASFFAMTQIAI